jgi:hypothetical protein
MAAVSAKRSHRGETRLKRINLPERTPDEKQNGFNGSIGGSKPIRRLSGLRLSGLAKQSHRLILAGQSAKTNSG